jgi:hypothetical protein
MKERPKPTIEAVKMKQQRRFPHAAHKRPIINKAKQSASKKPRSNKRLSAKN